MHDARVANLYYQEFMGLLGSMGVIAVEDFDGELLLTAYPNPTTSNLLLEIDTKLLGKQIDLKDLNGRDIMQLIPNNLRSSYDVSHLTPGIYLLSSSEFSGVKRIVIQ